MIKINFFLFLFLSPYLLFSSDEWIHSPRFGQLVDEVGAVSNLSFGLGHLLKNDFSSLSLRRKIIEKVPSLEPYRSTLLAGSEANFKNKLESVIQDEVLGQARVWTEDLEFGRYEQGEIPTKGIKIRPAYDGTAAVIRKYWRSCDSGVYYQVPFTAQESGFGFDPSILRLGLEKEAGAIQDVINKSRVSEVQNSDSLKYSGRSRHVFKTCAAPHPFHSGCIRKAIDQDPKCPTCRTAVSRKDLKYSPGYKKGEDCAICLEPISPVITAAVAAAGGSDASKTASKKRSRS